MTSSYPSSYPSWCLNQNFQGNGNVNYAGNDNNPLWNTGKKEVFQFSYIDKSNKPQTVWFRNLQLLLQRHPVVRLHVRNKEKKSNSATYLIKSFTRYDNYYSLQVQFIESTSNEIYVGQLDTELEFYYY